MTNCFLTRRKWFSLCAAALAGSSLKAASRDREQETLTSKHRDLIIHSSRPLDIETPPELLDTWITPVERFYVRSHFYIPSIDLAPWRCVVGGGVERPRHFSIEDLRAFEPIERTVTIECAGNGRARFRPRIPGTQWLDGAVGTARWKGVRLRDVLRQTGIRSDSRHVAFDGADTKVGNSPDFVRSIPIDKCLHPDTLLAYEMNGQVLPEAHGFPLRLITPGWEGAASVKWLTGITALDSEFSGPFMSRAYRMPIHAVEPGARVSPEETRPITTLQVKSLITHPRSQASFSSSPTEIKGFAWAGVNDIEEVKISTDGGVTWNGAELGADRAPFAWREFRYVWVHKRAIAPTVLMARATDSTGVSQPLNASWNPGGYLRNTVDRVLLDSSANESTVAALPEGPEKELLDTSCTLCHDHQAILSQRLSETSWRAEIDKMSDWGASLSEKDKKRLVDYLFRYLSDQE